MITFHLPVRYTIPLAFFIMLMGAGFLEFLSATARSSAKVETEMEAYASFSGTRLAETLERAYLRNDHESAENALAIEGAHPDLRVAMLMDASGQALITTNYEYRGKNLLAVWKGERGDIAKAALEKGRKAFRFTPDRLTAMIAFPVKLGAQEKELRPRLTGVLYMEFDLAQLKKQGRNEGLEDFLNFAWIVGGASLGAWVFLTLTLTSRMRKLTDMASRFSAGDYSARVELAGSDEMAMAGAVLNGAAEKLQKNLIALEESERRFRTMADNAPSMIWMGGDASRRSFFNQTWRNFTGGGVDEQAGEGWLTQVAPEDRERLAGRLGLASATRQSYEVEYRLKRSDGTFRWVLERGSPRFYADGGFAGFIGSLIDMTDRKVAMEELARLATAVEQTPETVIITDLDGKIVFVNSAFESSSGYSKEEVMGQNPRFLKSGSHDKEFYGRLWKTLGEGRTWQGRLVNRRKDGSLYEEDAVISPVFDAEGKILNYVAVKRDVSRESQLARAKMCFAAISSHELNTPLTKLTLVGMLLDKAIEGDASGLEFAKAVLGETFTRLKRISEMTSLLNSLATESDSVHLFRVFIKGELAESLREAKEAIVSAGRKTRLVERWEGIPDETTVLGDGAYLRRVFGEILSNAIKYTPDGKNVRVAAIVSGETLLVEIADEGIGFSPESRERMFEPFYSLCDPNHYFSSTHKFKGGGIGLGLTVARMIMEHIGGTIEVESAGENAGSTVTLRFPIVPASA